MAQGKYDKGSPTIERCGTPNNNYERKVLSMQHIPQLMRINPHLA
jgi:hypothetical protein